jgi:hypothetical protein
MKWSRVLILFWFIYGEIPDITEAVWAIECRFIEVDSGADRLLEHIQSLSTGIKETGLVIVCALTIKNDLVVNADFVQGEPLIWSYQLPFPVPVLVIVDDNTIWSQRI